MTRERRLAELDPTDPRRWPEQQARGRAAFQLRYGTAIGVLIALLYDIVLLVARHDLPVFFSARHAVQLLVIIVCVAPGAGLLLGRVLWRLGELRYGDALLTREFLEEGDGSARSEASQGRRSTIDSAAVGDSNVRS